MRTSATLATSTSGVEWIVEAYGCPASDLCHLDKVEHLFQRMFAELALRQVGETHWHQFPGSGGITGLSMLAESHLACHTFPEHGSLCLNLFCCVPRREWDFNSALREIFGASAVNIRRVERSYRPASKVDACRPTFQTPVGSGGKKKL